MEEKEAGVIKLRKSQTSKSKKGKRKMFVWQKSESFKVIDCVGDCDQSVQKE